MSRSRRGLAYLVRVGDDEDDLPFWSEHPVSVGDAAPWKGGCPVKVERRCRDGHSRRRYGPSWTAGRQLPVYSFEKRLERRR